MPWVWLSVGSNIDRRRQVSGAIRDLRVAFGDLRLSSVYESPALGFDGDPFYNLVAGFSTDMSVEELIARLQRIEDAHERRRGGNKFAPRTLDLDVLTYGDSVLTTAGGTKIPRDEITRHAFVLLPLAEVAGEERHPVHGRSYAELWRDFDQSSQPLSRVDFSFDDQAPAKPPR